MRKNKIIILLMAVVMMGGVMARGEGEQANQTTQPDDTALTAPSGDTTVAQYNDSTAERFNELTQQYFFKSLDMALDYANKALKANDLKTDKDTTEYLRTLNNKSYIYFHASRFDSVQKYIDSMKKITDKDQEKYKTEFRYYNIISMRMDLRKNLYDQAYKTGRENLREFHERNITTTDAEYFLKAAHSIGAASLNYYCNSHITDSIEVKLENGFDALGELLLVHNTVLQVKNPTKSDTMMLESMNLYIDYTFYNIYTSLYDAVITDTGNNVEKKIKTAITKVGEKPFFKGKLDSLNKELELGNYSKEHSLKLFLEKAIKHIDAHYDNAKKYDYFHAQYQQAFAYLAYLSQKNNNNSIITPIINKGVKHKEMFEKDSILSFYNKVGVLFEKWSGEKNMDYYQIMANNYHIGEYYRWVNNDTVAQKYFVAADSLNKKAAEYGAYNPKWEYDILKQLNDIDSANYYGKFRISQLYNYEIIRGLKNSFDKMDNEINQMKKDEWMWKLLFWAGVAAVVILILASFLVPANVKRRRKRMIWNIKNIVNIIDYKKLENVGDKDYKDYTDLLKSLFDQIYLNNNVFFKKLKSLTLAYYYFKDEKKNDIIKCIVKQMKGEQPVVNHGKNEPYRYQIGNLERPAILYLYYILNKEKKNKLCETIKKEIFYDTSKCENDNMFIAKLNDFHKKEYVDQLKRMLHEKKEHAIADNMGELRDDKLEDNIDAKSLIFFPVYNTLTKELQGIISIQSKNKNLFKVSKMDVFYNKMSSICKKILKCDTGEKEEIKTISEDSFLLIKDIIERNILEYDNKVTEDIREIFKKRIAESEKQITALEEQLAESSNSDFIKLKDELRKEMEKIFEEIKNLPNKAFIKKKHKLYNEYLTTYEELPPSKQFVFREFCLGKSLMEISKSYIIEQKIKETEITDKKDKKKYKYNLLRNLDEETLHKKCVSAFCLDADRKTKIDDKTGEEFVLAFKDKISVYLSEIRTAFKNVEKTRDIKDVDLLKIGVIIGKEEALKFLDIA